MKIRNTHAWRSWTEYTIFFSLSGRIHGKIIFPRGTEIIFWKGRIIWCTKTSFYDSVRNQFRHSSVANNDLTYILHAWYKVSYAKCKNKESRVLNVDTRFKHLYIFLLLMICVSFFLFKWHRMKNLLSVLKYNPQKITM